MVVLLLGFAQGHEGRLAESLASRQVTPFLVDGAQTHRDSLRLRLRDGVAHLSLSTPAGSLALNDVGCVWSGLQYPLLGGSHQSVEPQLLALEEWSSFIANLAGVTPTVPWVNPWFAARRAETRMWQLSRAAEVGLPTPDSLVTTDPDEVARFLGQHPAGLAIKPLTHRPLVTQRRGVTWRIYTHRLTSDSPQWKQLEAVRTAPVLVQEYISKQSEIRAYVIDGKTEAVELLSQSTLETQEDWRRSSVAPLTATKGASVREMPCRRFPLSEELSQQLRTLADRLELRYSAMDLVRTPENRIVFLEANDGGAWLQFEERAGLSVTRGITDLLVRLHEAHTATREPVPS